MVRPNSDVTIRGSLLTLLGLVVSLTLAGCVIAVPTQVKIIGIERQNENDATVAVIIRTIYGSADGCSVDVQPDEDQRTLSPNQRVAPQTQPVQQDQRVFENVPLDVGWNIITVRCGERPESMDTRREYRTVASIPSIAVDPVGWTVSPWS